MICGGAHDRRRPYKKPKKEGLEQIQLDEDIRVIFPLGLP